MGEMTTEKTQSDLAERLRAISISLQMEPGGDATTAKFVFDLREAAGLLDGLDELLGVILAEDAQEDPADTLGRALGVAATARDRLDKANPEPKVVGG